MSQVVEDYGLVRVEVVDLTAPMVIWVIAKLMGFDPVIVPAGTYGNPNTHWGVSCFHHTYNPITDWVDAGRVINTFKPTVDFKSGIAAYQKNHACVFGRHTDPENPLEAVCRAIVAGSYDISYVYVPDVFLKNPRELFPV